MIDRFPPAQIDEIRHRVIGRRRADVRQRRGKRRNAGCQVERRAQLGIRRDEGLAGIEALRAPLAVVNRDLTV